MYFLNVEHWPCEHLILTDPAKEIKIIFSTLEFAFCFHNSRRKTFHKMLNVQYKLSSGMSATTKAPTVLTPNYKHGLNHEMSDIREKKKQKKIKLKFSIHYVLWHGKRPRKNKKKGERKWNELVQGRSQKSTFRETDIACARERAATV